MCLEYVVFYSIGGVYGYGFGPGPVSPESALLSYIGGGGAGQGGGGFAA